MKQSFSTFLATWGYAGKIPFAPGTWGSMAALPFAYLIQYHFGGLILFFASLLLCAGGVWISDIYLQTSKRSSKDPKEVVIDEVAGQWLLLSVVPLTVEGYLIGFILFRIFDIVKPYPISWIDQKLEGGFGIMMDDMLAALFGMVIYIGFEEIIYGYAPLLS